MAEFREVPRNVTHMQPYELWVVFEDEGIPVVAPVIAWSGKWADELKPAVAYAGKIRILQGWRDVFPSYRLAVEYVGAL